MEFLKNHYEKVILGVVLLALAVVAAWLPMQISGENRKLKDALVVTKREPAPRDLIDLTEIEFIREQVQNPPKADLAGSHNTFNSVVWRKMPDGNLIKLRPEDVGVNKLKVEAIEPLNFVIEYDKVSGSGYYFNVTREQASRPADRRRRGYYVSRTSGKKNNIFTLEEVRGEEKDPLAFVLKLSGTDEEIVLSKSRPYHVTNGYSATIVYPPENKNWKLVRNKEPLVFAGDTNIIVDINPAEVILRAVSNEKTTTIPF
jgi:hypothetical protein